MPGDTDIVDAQLARAPCRAAASLARRYQLANAGVAIPDHVGRRLFARQEDLAVEDDDRAVTAARDALHQQLLRGGEDLARGYVELRAVIGDGHVLVAGAVVGFEQHRQAEPLRVRVRASDVALRTHAPDVVEAATGR